jgi:hypothetical protein
MKFNKCNSLKLVIVIIGMALAFSISPKFLPSVEFRQIESHLKKTIPQIVESVSTTTSDSYNYNSGCSSGFSFNEISRKCEPNDSGKKIIQNMVAPKIVENLGVFKNEEGKQDKENTTWVSPKSEFINSIESVNSTQALKK